MIKTVYLRNFQSHKETELNLHPGVNVIIGDTDAGKSAIIRALYWLAFGRPSGNSFLRHNTKKSCLVEVKLINDTVVQRYRGRSINSYFVNDDEYAGFGQTVPEPVQKALQLTPLNFARQLDPPFLFSKSPGEIAQYLNTLIDLDVIGKSLSHIGKEVKRSNVEMQQHRNLKLDLQKEHDDLSWVDAAEKDLVTLEVKENEIVQLRSSKKQLGAALEAYFSAKQTLDAAPNVKGLQTAIAGLESTMYEITQLRKDKNTLRKLIDTYYTALDNEKYCIAQEQKYTLQYRQQCPDICPLCDQPIPGKKK